MTAASSDRPFLPLHKSSSYDRLWRELEKVVTAHLPISNLALFAEIAHETVPQILHSTGRLYESLPTEICRNMIVTSPLLGYLRSNPGRRIVHWQDYGGTEKEHISTSHFRKYLKPHGWWYFINLCVYRKQNHLGGLLLARTRAQGDFSQADRTWLEELYPHLETALLRCAAHFEESSRHAAARNWCENLPHAAILIDWNLTPVLFTRAGREALQKWSSGPTAGRPVAKSSLLELPADLRAIIRRWKETHFRRLLAYQPVSADGPIEHPHPTANGLSAWIRVIPPVRGSRRFPLFEVTFSLPEPSPEPATRLLLDRTRRLLTAGERELLDHILQGLSNQEIADQLSKSIGTVKNQISAIYTKLGVKARPKLLALARHLATDT